MTAEDFFYVDKSGAHIFKDGYGEAFWEGWLEGQPKEVQDSFRTEWGRTPGAEAAYRLLKNGTLSPDRLMAVIMKWRLLGC